MNTAHAIETVRSQAKALATALICMLCAVALVVLVAGPAHAGVVVTEGKINCDDKQLVTAKADGVIATTVPVDDDDDGDEGTTLDKGDDEDDEESELGDLDAAPDDWNCENIGGGIELCETEQQGQQAAADDPHGDACRGGLAMGDGMDCAGGGHPAGAIPMLMALIALVAMRRRAVAR